MMVYVCVCVCVHVLALFESVYACLKKQTPETSNQVLRVFFVEATNQRL